MVNQDFLQQLNYSKEKEMTSSPPNVIIVTVEYLQEAEACEEEVELFQKLFGNSVELTEENLQIAAENKLDIYWFGKTRFGPIFNKRSYNDLMEYTEKCKPYYDQYVANIRSAAHKWLHSAERNTSLYNQYELECRQEYEKQISFLYIEFLCSIKNVILDCINNPIYPTTKYF